MRVPAAAYYHWPPVWVGAAPSWATYPQIPTEEDIDVSVLDDEVYRTVLSAGIPVRVLREGVFIFDFSSWEPGCPLPEEPFPCFAELASVALRRASVMNAHLACLYNAPARLQIQSYIPMVVTPGDLIGLDSFEAASPSTNPGGINEFSARSQLYVLGCLASTYRPNTPIPFAWRLRYRDPVAESFRLLNIILDRRDPEQLLDMIDLYLRGWRDYQDHNYGQSLVNMWTVSEQLIQELWKRYIRDNRQRELNGQTVNFITRPRKEQLEDSRTFTAAVISEVLSLTGIIPFALYRELSKARKARNDWVHDLVPVSYEVAAEAGKAAEQLLRLVEGIDLEVPLQLHLHG